MELITFIIDFHKTPIELRERVSFTDSKKIKYSNLLLENGADEVLVLSTCNRTEVYFASSQSHEPIKFLKDLYKRDLSVEDIDSYLVIKKNADCVTHICEVAAGLDSLVLGEDQILGQVKESLQTAIELGFSRKFLNRLFQTAIKTAKQIKTKTKISEIPTSISYIGVRLLEEKLRSLKGKNALLIGSGAMGMHNLKYLQNRNLNKIYIAVRNNKAIDVRDASSDIEFVDFDERKAYYKNVDLIVSSTSAPHPLMYIDDLNEITRNLYILDLAVPRDVDESCGDLDLVNLFDIDDLIEVANENNKEKLKLKKKADIYIMQNVEDYFDWISHVKYDRVFKSIHEKCSDVLSDSMNYLTRKIDLTKREKNIIESTIKNSMKRVLIQPVVEIKQDGNSNHKEKIEFLEILFKK